MSQHRLCGQRVAKTLDQRTHNCQRCGLRGDRDIVSAALAAASSSLIPTIRAPPRPKSGRRGTIRKQLAPKLVGAA